MRAPAERRPRRRALRGGPRRSSRSTPERLRRPELRAPRFPARHRKPEPGSRPVSPPALPARELSARGSPVRRRPCMSGRRSRCRRRRCGLRRRSGRRRGRGLRLGCGRRGRSWCRACRQVGERIAVALRIGPHPNPEVDVRTGELGRPGGADGSHRRLPRRPPCSRRRRSEPRCVSVTARPSAVAIVTTEPEPGTLPAKVTVPAAGARTVSTRAGAHVDPAMLAGRVRMRRVEDERLQDAAAHRPRPRLCDRRGKRAQPRPRERSLLASPPPLLSVWENVLPRVRPAQGVVKKDYTLVTVCPGRARSATCR